MILSIYEGQQVDMQTYQYYAKAIDCLIQNKRKLGITDEIASQILCELNSQHRIDDWETEWLTFSDESVYLGLTCINQNQKVKLWSLVQELLEYFETIAPHIQSQRVSMLLTQLHTLK